MRGKLRFPVKSPLIVRTKAGWNGWWDMAGVREVGVGITDGDLEAIIWRIRQFLRYWMSKIQTLSALKSRSLVHHVQNFTTVNTVLTALIEEVLARKLGVKFSVCQLLSTRKGHSVFRTQADLQNHIPGMWKLLLFLYCYLRVRARSKYLLHAQIDFPNHFSTFIYRKFSIP